MPRVRDLLYRFRPATAPGSASATAVPAEFAQGMARELEPVFAQLTSTERECDDTVSAGLSQAGTVLARCTERAQTLLASASRRAEAERADTAVRASRSGEERAATNEAAARQRATAIHRHAEEMMAQYVARVVDTVRELMR